jgi:hypothetical protein
MARPNLAGQLPYYFPNGGATIQQIDTNCASCNAEIGEESIRAEFVVTNPHVVTLTGHAICNLCESVTPIDARFNSDGNMLFKSGDDWERGRFIKSKGPVEKIIDKLKACFSRKNEA